MKIPKTNSEYPFIEFTFDKNYNLKLQATSIWWGGINHSFVGSNDIKGNSCKPKDLKKYIVKFLKKNFKEKENTIKKATIDIMKLREISEKIQKEFNN